MTHPGHIAIIMDGNGRWAQRRSMPRIAGHRAGVRTVREVVRACAELGIGTLTLFAFSSENWRRPPQEVSLLMDLFLVSLDNEVQELHEQNVRLRIIGELSAFPERLQQRIAEAEEMMAGNTGLNLNIAANYGGRWDIVQAARSLGEDIAAGKLAPRELTDERLAGRLLMSGFAEPDLFIRTGGEKRISNFLLWQLAYTELYFTDVLWPDFDRAEFDAALAFFATRQRRFGQTGEQVEETSRAIKA